MEANLNHLFHEWCLTEIWASFDYKCGQQISSKEHLATLLPVGTAHISLFCYCCRYFRNKAYYITS